ncbi:uncharacterized protein LOC141631519 [Silene latifolia]|uniref:uncharacterized protein LOC141631519 n=1 Tax=Silene latifolia TaxID=37657 RepID=UPI003D772B20
MCFNFLTKKLEILHLMRPEMVNFAPSIEPTKDFVIKCLLKKMSSIVAVRDMKPEEIILRSNLGNGSDSGIYLMRLLEKYKGERRTCVLGLQDNNQVKVFGTRACYELLSFAGNQDFQNLRKNPRGATKDTRQCQLLDTEILARVINARKDDKYLDEIIVAPLNG